MLSDTPRQKLAALITLDGYNVASDAKLCEALLRDYCGEYRVEIAALTAAVRWGVPKSLSEAGQIPPATLRANLVRRLQENHGLAEDAAFWAVDAWASILGHPVSATPAVGDPGTNAAWDIGNTRSMPVEPVSPPLRQSPPAPPQPQAPPLPPRPSSAPLPKPPSPQWQPPPLPKPQSQPQSPILPPLPKPPSEPQLPPLPRPPYQPQSPVLPPLPRPSEPRPPSLPPLPAAAAYPQPPVPQPQSLPFVAAAQAFESRVVTAQLQQVQIYLKVQLRRRKSADLVEELRLAGVEVLTARRLVARTARGAAVKHFWVALAIFVISLLTMRTLSVIFGYRQELLLLSACAFVYFAYRGVRLIGTF